MSILVSNMYIHTYVTKSLDFFFNFECDLDVYTA